MVDKVEAINLRTQGLSYSEIAQQLGCSEAWCKINLKGVEKGVREHTDATATRLKAISILEKALQDIREI